MVYKETEQAAEYFENRAEVEIILVWLKCEVIKNT